jgi:hypothetical protein
MLLQGEKTIVKNSTILIFTYKRVMIILKSNVI